MLSSSWKKKTIIEAESMLCICPKALNSEKRLLDHKAHDSLKK